MPTKILSYMLRALHTDHLGNVNGFEPRISGTDWRFHTLPNTRIITPIITSTTTGTTVTGSFTTANRNIHLYKHGVLCHTDS